ncbi:hypothetical protein NL676_004318 [Syzygium grande]|nr:hypothetical protein NL676_004318 [Syzygium grande]
MTFGLFFFLSSSSLPQATFESAYSPRRSVQKIPSPPHELRSKHGSPRDSICAYEIRARISARSLGIEEPIPRRSHVVRFPWRFRRRRRGPGPEMVLLPPVQRDRRRRRLPPPSPSALAATRASSRSAKTLAHPGAGALLSSPILSPPSSLCCSQPPPPLTPPPRRPPAATFDLQNPGLFSIPSSSPSGGSDNLFDPLAFLMNHLQDLQSSGAQIQFVVENSPSEGRGGGGFRLPANIDDYFMGPGLEQLIQQLAENDPNRHGTPPASKSAVENLPTIKVTEELQNSEMNQCAVCQDDFEKDMEVKQMPCKHIYHADCLLPWLELHNSCPVCRHELPTDDPNYENRRGAAQGNVQGGSSGTSSGRGENRSFQRSFSITLPFRGNDGSNSGSGGE